MTLRPAVLLLLAAFAVGSGCVCKGQPMRWMQHPEEMNAFKAPADLDWKRDRGNYVAWVLEWNGETGSPVEGVRTVLVCRLHRLTEKARSKLIDMRFMEPLILAPDELIDTGETVFVHSNIELGEFQAEVDRHGPLGLWPATLDGDEKRVVLLADTLPCEVRRQSD